MTPEEVELLSELTIIIPTYNRPLELERSIEYWRDTPVTVHILDGSEKPWFPVGSLKGVQNIYYHHWLAENSKSPMESFFQRLLYGSKLPVTQFSAFGCDDDFYTISGLIQSLKILMSDKSIDATVGRVLTYQQGKKLYWYHKYVPRVNRTDLLTKNIESKLATGSSWFLYAVCRTEIWKTFLATCYEEKRFTNINFYAHEWMLFLLSKAMFQTNYLEMIQIVRQDTIIGKNKPPEIPWEEFICDERNALHVDEIIKQLAKGFNEVTPESEHAKNLELAREQMRREQVKARKSRTEIQKRKTIKSVLGNVLFFFLPGLNIFADRPRRLKYLWRISKFQYSVEQQREVEEIEKLLLKPRGELRLKANI